MRAESTKDWRQLLEDGYGEREKREDLLAATLWALGVESRGSRLKNSGGDSSRGLLTKLLTEWILWKWPTSRGLPDLKPTKDNPIYELWTEGAIGARDTSGPSKNEKSIRHEHAIPRSVLANALIGLESSGANKKELVKDLLRLFSVEVTMLKTEADSLDKYFKDKLPPGPNLTCDSSPDFVWRRYAEWSSKPEVTLSSGFAIWIVPRWKEGRTWKHGWHSDASQRHPRCGKVFPTSG